GWHGILLASLWWTSDLVELSFWPRSCLHTGERLIYRRKVRSHVHCACRQATPATLTPITNHVPDYQPPVEYAAACNHRADEGSLRTTAARFRGSGATRDRLYRS